MQQNQMESRESREAGVVEKEAAHREIREENHQQKKSPEPSGKIALSFYTDPLCCWSWAFEKPWRELLGEFSDHIANYRYVMCGMVRDWKTYNDPMHSVSRPLHMGPVWMHASEVTQVKMKYSIWHEDPPESSLPACLAVKTAGLQSRHAEDVYLLELRKALMEEGMNISRPSVLFDVARKLDASVLDFAKFANDWKAGNAKNALRADLNSAKIRGIARYPTLTIHRNGNGIMLVGYRPYAQLREVIERFINNEFSPS